MAVVVTNNTGADYRLPDRRVIPDGESVILTDEELQWIPVERRKTELIITALAVDVASPTYDIEIDEPSTGTTYVGEASPNSDTADPVWRIKRIYISGSVTSIRYADGTNLFDKVWNDRTGYSY